MNMACWAGRLATARRLPAALAILAFVEVALRRLPLPRLCELLGVRMSTGLPSGTVAAVRPLDARDVARCRAVHRLLQVWPGGRRRGCLRLALVTGRLLRHRDPQLRIGVARVDGSTVAHAWLNVDGLVLDPTADRYAPLHGSSE